MSRFACSRPSKVAGWLLHDGTWLPARCGASNKCAYCGYLATVENALVVALDAEVELPRVGLTLTTKDPPSSAVFRDGVRSVIDVVRYHLGPDVGYLGFIEFTTGKAKTSGGIRRPHTHMLLKRCAPAEAEAIEHRVRMAWYRAVGADRVEMAELRSPAGATAYLVHHHRKREQQPPEGWRGKRMRPSRNYWFGEAVDGRSPIEQRRLQARLMLRDKRLRRAANKLVAWEELDGAPDELLDAEWRAARARAQQEASWATFCKVGPTGELRPIRQAA